MPAEIGFPRALKCLELEQLLSPHQESSNMCILNCREEKANVAKGWQIDDQLMLNRLISQGQRPVRPTAEDPAVVWGFNNTLRTLFLPALLCAAPISCPLFTLIAPVSILLISYLRPLYPAADWAVPAGPSMTQTTLS